MENITEKVIEKAKKAKTCEELIELAKGEGVEISAEEAKYYLELLNPKTGELSDDELDDVSGGACKSRKSKKTVVTAAVPCFTGQYINNRDIITNSAGNMVSDELIVKDNEALRRFWSSMCAGKENRCGTCQHLKFEGGVGVCGVS